MSDIKKWDNDIVKFEVSEASRQLNPFLQDYGRDRYSYVDEMTYTSAAYYSKTEGPFAHGYPATAWLQLGLIYMIGLYTAKEQGIVKKGVYF